MFRVAQIVERKLAFGHGAVAIAWPHESVLDAAKRMNDRKIGSLVVCDAHGSIVGMLTERDMLTRVVAAERSPSETLVGDVMTQTVSTCTPDHEIAELRDMMHKGRYRHVPVEEDGRLVGMVSMGDLNAAESENLVEAISQLETYIRSG
jgi:CBS domain-containing protein